MQCYEFEVMCHTLYLDVLGVEPGARFDKAELAKTLEDFDIKSLAELNALAPRVRSQMVDTLVIAYPVAA